MHMGDCVITLSMKALKSRRYILLCIVIIIMLYTYVYSMRIACATYTECVSLPGSIRKFGKASALRA